MKLNNISTAFLTLLTTVSASTTISNVKYTFYGWPNNSPPSNLVANACDGRDYVAQGSGAYDYPLTFASAPGEFEPCEVVYSPYLKKYLIMDDTCAQCTTDWDDEGIYHVDVWDMAGKNGGQAENDCDYALTPDEDQTIIRYPADNLAVQAGGLYEYGASPACQTQNVFP